MQIAFHCKGRARTMRMPTRIVWNLDLYLIVDYRQVKVIDVDYNVQVGYWDEKNNVQEYKVYVIVIQMFDLNFVNNLWQAPRDNPWLAEPINQFIMPSKISIRDEQNITIFIGRNVKQKMAKKWKWSTRRHQNCCASSSRKDLSHCQYLFGTSCRRRLRSLGRGFGDGQGASPWVHQGRTLVETSPKVHGEGRYWWWLKSLPGSLSRRNFNHCRNLFKSSWWGEILVMAKVRPHKPIGEGHRPLGKPPHKPNWEEPQQLLRPPKHLSRGWILAIVETCRWALLVVEKEWRGAPSSYRVPSFLCALAWTY